MRRKPVLYLYREIYNIISYFFEICVINMIACITCNKKSSKVVTLLYTLIFPISIFHIKIFLNNFKMKINHIL